MGIWDWESIDLPKGPLTGGSLCHMSILRNGHVALSIFRNGHVGLLNIRN